jgi:DHA1 family tetracycline resistance protein-like MFS transporter
MRGAIGRRLIPYGVVILLAYVGFSMPLPIFPEMFLDSDHSLFSSLSLNMKMVLLGLIMASFPLGQFFGSPLLGKLSDRYGRKKIILTSLAGTTLGYLITAYFAHESSFVGMFIGLTLCGFCEGNVTIAQSVIADLTEGKEKASYFGWINIFISVGFILGPLMGGQLADPSLVSWFDFSTPFWAAACLTLVGMGVIYFYSDETLKESSQKESVTSIWSCLKKPELKRFYLANFFIALGYFSFFRFFPVFLERTFNFTPSQLSYIMVYNSLIIGCGVFWLIPYLSRKMKTSTTLSLFSFLFAFSCIISLLPTTPYALIFTLVPVGLSLAAVITNGALLISDKTSLYEQGQALGTLTSVQVLAEVITGLAGGYLAATFLELPFYLGALMCIVCALILYRR